jgi:hypothetical protein
MAPGRPVKLIKVKAPRHNAQRIGTKLGAEIQRISKEQKLKTEIYQPSPDILQAVVSRIFSECSNKVSLCDTFVGECIGMELTIDKCSCRTWSSMGCWDSTVCILNPSSRLGAKVNSVRFMVDKYSDLYYDPTSLREAVKKQLDEEKGESGDDSKDPAPSHHPPLPQQLHHSNSRHHTPRGDRDFHTPHHPMGPPMHDSPIRHHPPPVNYNYPQTPSNMNMRGPPPPQSIPRPFPGHGGGPPGTPFNSGPSGQFFGNEGGSPMRMNPMGGMGMMDHGMGGVMGNAMSPMGMGMGGGSVPMGGNPMGGMGGGMPMGGMPINMSPDTRRMSMGGDAFPMH